MTAFLSDLLRRPLAYASVGLCLGTTLAIFIRLLPNKNARKAYHIVITVQIVIDLIDATIRVFCNGCGLFYIELIPRFLRVISWLQTAVTAIYWMSLFFQRSWDILVLSIILFVASTPVALAYPYFMIAKSDLNFSHQENIAIAWIKAVCLTFCALVVIYCLVRVLRLPKSTFTTATTFKGYRKVAMGLGLKTTSVLAVAITSAHDAVRQTTNVLEIPQWMFMFIDIYPATNACVTFWMVSRLLKKQTNVVVIDVRGSSEGKI